MYFRKIVSLITVIILVFCCAVPASATVQTPSEFSNNGSADMESDEVHVLNGMERSLSIPTESWDLSKSNYSAVLEMVGRSMLYTNCYFKANSKGVLYVDYDVVAQGGATFRIGVYNVDTGTVVASNDIAVNAAGKEDTATFSSLSTTAKYAIFFMSVYDGFSVVYVTGSAEIHH